MTLRTRVTAFAAVAVLVVLTLAGIAVLREQQRLLLETVDESLEQQAAAALVDVDRPVVTAPGDDDGVAQLVVEGRVVEAVGRVDGTKPIAPTPTAGRTIVRSLSGVVDGEPPYRVLSVGLDSDRALHLAVPLDDVRDSRAALLTTLLVIGPLTAVLLAAVIWWFVGRALQPVEAMRAEVSTIGGGDLHRRVVSPEVDDEVGRLGRTLNDMLGRLQRADEQQRRFVADASHELRTPLTRMRSELEVDLVHPDTADPLATHRSVLEEVDGLQALVDDLLQLARTDAGGGWDPAEVDLGEVARHVVSSTPIPAGVTVHTTEVDGVRVLGHAGSLRRAAANLLDNAVRHARSRVWVSVRSVGGTVSMVVADDGPGVPADQRVRVFERFTRLDEARTGGGAGLGLSIVQAVVAAHGGTVSIDDRPGGGARLTVSLPTSARSDAAPGDDRSGSRDQR